jgi:hypothetical protein
LCTHFPTTPRLFTGQPRGIDQAPDDPTDNEGGFHPDYHTKFPKIEREVHAAVLALARAALG